MNETEYINQVGNSDFGIYFILGYIVLQLGIYLLTSWGLWKINKKLGEPHAWLSWVPIVNIYSYVRAAGYPNIWILWLILGAIAMIIPIIGIIVFLILIIKVLHAISKRCGRGAGTTVGFLFIPFIMFPIVGAKFKPTNIKNENSEKTVEL